MWGSKSSEESESGNPRGAAAKSDHGGDPSRSQAGSLDRRENPGRGDPARNDSRRENQRDRRESISAGGDPADGDSRRENPRSADSTPTGEVSSCRLAAPVATDRDDQGEEVSSARGQLRAASATPPLKERLRSHGRPDYSGQLRREIPRWLRHPASPSEEIGFPRYAAAVDAALGDPMPREWPASKPVTQITTEPTTQYAASTARSEAESMALRHLFNEPFGGVRPEYRGARGEPLVVQVATRSVHSKQASRPGSPGVSQGSVPLAAGQAVNMRIGSTSGDARQTDQRSEAWVKCQATGRKPMESRYLTDRQTRNGEIPAGGIPPRKYHAEEFSAEEIQPRKYSAKKANAANRLGDRDPMVILVPADRQEDQETIVRIRPADKRDPAERLRSAERVEDSRSNVRNMRTDRQDPPLWNGDRPTE